MDGLRFSIPEILALFGVAQCVYILVYMAFRSGRLSRATLPFIYFLVLAFAFLSDASYRHIESLIPYFDDIQWALWFSGPPLSMLLIIQIAQISKMPSWKHYWVLLLIPTSYLLSYFLSADESIRFEFLTILGLISGAISLLAIWGNSDLWSHVIANKKTKDRYWLVIAIILTNIVFLAITLTSVSLPGFVDEVILLRTVLGIGFVYLISTSLFRIYPQAVELMERRADIRLNEDEFVVARHIETLLILDKIYHEPSYSRRDLAKECEISEAVLSKIINIYFKQSFPTLMNRHRVEDAKRLLKQTKAHIKIIAQEVGFNSVASFNRVFRDEVGVSPSVYRDQ